MCNRFVPEQNGLLSGNNVEQRDAGSCALYFYKRLWLFTCSMGTHTFVKIVRGQEYSFLITDFINSEWVRRPKRQRCLYVFVVEVSLLLAFRSWMYCVLRNEHKCVVSVGSRGRVRISAIVKKWASRNALAPNAFNSDQLSLTLGACGNCLRSHNWWYSTYPNGKRVSARALVTYRLTLNPGTPRAWSIQYCIHAYVSISFNDWAARIHRQNHVR